MNSDEVLRIVDAIHRDKNIDKEIVFEGIEQAILSAAKKHYGEESNLVATVDRVSGQSSVKLDGQEIPQEEMDLLGRIAAQTAKQVLIQKVREAERDALYDEFNAQRHDLVNGTVTRIDHGVAIVNLGKVEALLPKSEQIPGEQHRVNERVRAVVLEVRKVGSRIKVILSRNHPELVRRLFEVEIPEVSESIIKVQSLAREAGYRSKVAVSCIDNSIDAVGACVGVRGSRIRSIVDELAGERIDIVRWNDSLQVLIPNALQPAEVEDVILCPMLGRVIVLVKEDQLSLAIGKKGQNVRLASKLVGWDIEVMTREELDEQLDQSVAAFSVVPHITEELAEVLVSQGFFSFDDLSVIEPDQLAELGSLTEEQCDEIVAYADVESAREEKEAEVKKEHARQTRLADAAAAAEAAEAAEQASGDTHDAGLAQEVAADLELASQEVVATETEAVGEEESVKSSVADAAAVGNAQDDLASIGMGGESSQGNGAAPENVEAAGDAAAAEQ
ncbi:MAG: transcription termination factor NusA [Planctomycetaceae bacterium]|nr:transcription termination factor NusA [Planctomycetaceae bacterium]